MKHCVECKHCIPGNKPEFSRCGRSFDKHGAVYQNWMVSGTSDDAPTESHYFCGTERVSSGDDSCGEAAKFFESKS